MVLVGDEREGASNEIIYASRDRRVGMDERVWPYFFLVVLRGICYWLFCLFYLMPLINMSFCLYAGKDDRGI